MNRGPQQKRKANPMTNVMTKNEALVYETINLLVGGQENPAEAFVSIRQIEQSLSDAHVEMKSGSVKLAINSLIKKGLVCSLPVLHPPFGSYSTYIAKRYFKAGMSSEKRTSLSMSMFRRGLAFADSEVVNLEQEAQIAKNKSLQNFINNLNLKIESLEEDFATKFDREKIKQDVLYWVEWNVGHIVEIEASLRFFKRLKEIIDSFMAQEDNSEFDTVEKKARHIKDIIDHFKIDITSSLINGYDGWATSSSSHMANTVGLYKSFARRGIIDWLNVNTWGLSAILKVEE